MGCSNSKQTQLLPMRQCQSINGLLKVTIQEANISKVPSKFFDKVFGMDPYLILRMSNQQFKGYIHKKSNRQALFNESFQFIINSCYKQNGRSVQIQVWDECSINDKMIGMGTVDIDPIINLSQKSILGNKSILQQKQNNQKKQKDQSLSNSNIYLRKNQCKMKVFLNNDCQRTGFLNTIFQFYQQPIEIIGFRFIYANLREKSTIFSKKIWIQVIAGQQVLGTHKQKDQKTRNPPSWQDQMLIFNIPSCLKHCLIRVMNDKQEIGKLRLPVVQILNKKGQHAFTEEIQHGETVTGVIKFTISIGMKSVIEQMKKQSNVKIQTKSATRKINQTNTQALQRQPLKQVSNTMNSNKNKLINQQQQNQPIQQQISTSQSINEQSHVYKQKNNQIQNENEYEKKPTNLKTQQSMFQTTANYTNGNQEQNNSHSKVHTINSSKLVMQKSNNYGY